MFVRKTHVGPLGHSLAHTIGRWYIYSWSSSKLLERIGRANDSLTPKLVAEEGKALISREI